MNQYFWNIYKGNLHYILMFLFCMILILSSYGIQAKPVSSPGEFVTIPETTLQTTAAETEIPVKIIVSSFMIGRTEVTQNQFKRVMGYNPSFYKGDNHPVEGVSWWDAIHYCNLRSRQEGLEPCYDLSTGECDFSKNGYRLPTNTEWRIASGYTDTEFDYEEVNKRGNLGVNNVTEVKLLSDELQSGTTPVGQYAPNRYGLYDMIGNVWEWCYDFYHAINTSTPAALNNPVGNYRGVQRTIQGGSFVSIPLRKGRGVYRTSMKPEYSSRFTGFRVVRSVGPRTIQRQIEDSDKWFAQFDRAPEGFRNNLGPVSSLLLKESGGKINSLSGWDRKRDDIEKKWNALVGEPSVDKSLQVNVQVIETYDEDIYTGKLIYLEVEPGLWEKIYLMIPKNPVRTPTPVIITPYYDVDVPAGKNLGGYYMPKGVRHFSYLAVQQGYISIAVKWFGESYGESYPEAVANLHIRHPGCSGMGKWVWDSKRVVDYLYTLPEVDTKNIGIIGHSLGHKLALYSAAMDKRISAVVISDGGISLRFCNYDAYWYFGKHIREVQEHTDQHELLGILAPRPLLLIGGNATDKDESWYYINAGREVYSLYNKSENIGFFNHATGHSPTPEAVKLAFEWLNHFLNNEE